MNAFIDALDSGSNTTTKIDEPWARFEKMKRILESSLSVSACDFEILTTRSYTFILESKHDIVSKATLDIIQDHFSLHGIFIMVDKIYISVGDLDSYENT